MKEVKKPVLHLDPLVEAAVVLACCSQPRFYAALGHAIEADRLVHPAAKQLMAAVHAVAAKHGGKGPTWAPIVIQQVETLVSRGKATWDELSMCKDYLIEAECPSVEELVASVTPVVQRALHREVLASATDDFTRGAAPGETAVRFEKLAGLGRSPQAGFASIESFGQDDSFFEVDRDEDLLKTGCHELDDALEGGVERQSLTLFVGGTGSGKSMALSHVATESMLVGRHVFLVTLELSGRRCSHRIWRNIANMTKHEMLIDKVEAKRRVEQAMKQCNGKLVVVEMDPIVTSPADIQQALASAMREDQAFKPEVFVIDFLDKVRTDVKARLYDDMLVTTDKLRSIAVEHNGWTITASQGTRQAETRAWVELEVVADSMNKVRSADVVVGIGRTREDRETEMVRFALPKRREGEGAGARIGPVPWDPARGRICVVSGRNLPW